MQDFWSDPLSSEVQIKAKEVICSEKQSKMVWLREGRLGSWRDSNVLF